MFNSIQKKNIINNKFKKKTICYLGSIGKMYLLDQVLDFFEILNNKKEYQLKLIVNQKKIAKKMLKKKYKTNKNYVSVVSVDHNKVKSYLSKCDFLLSFIKPGFSKIASSPTKNIESLSCGIPIITNKGIGDDYDIIIKNKVGVYVNLPINETYKSASLKVKKLQNVNKQKIFTKMKNFYDINKNYKKYNKIYDQLS